MYFEEETERENKTKIKRVMRFIVSNPSENRIWPNFSRVGAESEQTRPSKRQRKAFVTPLKKCFKRPEAKWSYEDTETEGRMTLIKVFKFKDVRILYIKVKRQSVQGNQNTKKSEIQGRHCYDLASRFRGDTRNCPLVTVLVTAHIRLSP